MRWALLFLGLMVSPAAAEPKWVDYVDSPKEKKGAFLTGVIATMGIYYELAGKSDDLKYCFQKLKLSNGDVIQGAEKFVAEQHPTWKNVEAAQVLVGYINTRCGLVPPKT